MSFIGKILVVMQLVLSICLMIFAGAVSSYQTNWKAKSEATQKQLEQAQQNLSKIEQDAKNAADKFNADLKTEQEKGRELAARVSQLTLQVTNLSGDLKRVSEELAQKTQISTDLADDSNARQSEVRLVREKLKLAYDDRDNKYKELTALQDKIFEQQTKLDRLTDQNKALMVDNKNYRDVLNKAGLPLEIEAHLKVQNPPPKVEGKVLEARKSKEGSEVLLTISLGENDGLVVGNELIVFRRGESPKFLGKARVLDIQADTAVCTLFQRSGLVEKGDDVATKLN